MNEPENSSAGWGDPESIIDDSFSRRSLRNFLTTIGVLSSSWRIGIGIILWRQNEKKKTASVEANVKSFAGHRQTRQSDRGASGDGDLQ